MADFPQITQQDLQDPTLARFNRILSNLAKQITDQTAATAATSTPSATNQRPQTDASALRGRNISPNAPADGQVLEWSKNLNQWVPSTISVLSYGTHAARLAATKVDAAGWVETDRGNVLYQVQSGAWKYVSGVYTDVQANIPAGLGAGDTGFRFYISDYAHMLRWTGTVWICVDDATHRIDFCAVAPGTGWHLCDGSVVNYLVTDVSDGTVGHTKSITLPNLTTNFAFGKFQSTYDGTIHAATVPTTGVNSASQANVAVTGATSVAAAPHTHSVSLPGDPVAWIGGLPYFRL